MDGGDAVLVGELAHKTKPADTASETSSLPEQKGFRGFVLLDTQDFTGEPKKVWQRLSMYGLMRQILRGIPRFVAISGGCRNK